jgi:hypothetical protein
MEKVKLNQIIEYGKATSGIFNGMPTRGYFGIGLKDACYALGSGEIITKKNGNWNYVKFYFNDNNQAVVKGPIDHKPTTIEENIEIPEDKNGTIVNVSISNNIKIPRVKNFRDELLKNVCLRDIFTDDKCEVYLNYGKSQAKLKWKQKWENIETLVDKEHYISYDNKRIPIYIKIYKANQDLNWNTKLNSERGLLIRSNNAIHEITLFNRHRQMSLRRINGIITIPYLDELLKKEEEIITQSRDGINWIHPFGVKLQDSLSEIIEKIDIEEQRKIYSKSDLDDLTKKTLKSLEKIFKDIFKSELEEDDLPEIRRLMLEHSSGRSLPDFGFKINKVSIYKNYPIEINLFLKKSKNAQADMQIHLNYDKNFIDVNPNLLVLSSKNLLEGYYKFVIMIKGKLVGTTFLDASFRTLNSNLEINIIALDEIEFDFHPKSKRIPIGTSSKVRLFINKQKITFQDIELESDNPRVNLRKNKIEINDLFQMFDNYYFTDLTIEVSELCHNNEEAIIESKVKNSELGSQLKVICYKPDKNPNFFKPDINTNVKDPELPVELDDLFGKITVYARHNTVYGFWKDDVKKIQSNIFKLRLADLFIDKLIDALISIKFKEEMGIKYSDYETEKRRLYKKYGSKIFESLGLL